MDSKVGNNENVGTGKQLKFIAEITKTRSRDDLVMQSKGLLNTTASFGCQVGNEVL